LPDIVSQFINNGLRCITDILTGCITAQTEDITECVRRAGEVLRVLSFVTEPLRQEASMLPPLESRIQEEFFTAICGKFKDIESLFSSDNGISSAGYDLTQITHAVIFLSRLLQFYLGFRGSWSPAQKTAASNLSLTIFRLATVRHFRFAHTQIVLSSEIQLHSTGNAGDLVAFPLLMDTLYYLIDGVYATRCKNYPANGSQRYPRTRKRRHLTLSATIPNIVTMICPLTFHQSIAISCVRCCLIHRQTPQWQL
jgi:mediator of RNA polymerase II transcription subunit 12, fungi type